jgi:hypothetical protein
MKTPVAIACMTVLLAAGATNDVDRVPFSHADHKDTDDTLMCSDCHDASQARPALHVAKCQECHDELPAILSRTPTQHLSFPVDHRPHQAVSCASCHVRRDAPDDDKTPEHNLVVTSQSCFACHAGKERAPREQACITCHRRDERRERPESHATPWRRSHATSAMFQAPGSQHGQSCTLCHRESTCKTCHRVQAPRDHTATWSERTHGIVASFDSQRCKTCHESGQCVGCHRTTEPRNHSASWPSTHGLVARTKSDASCTTCHRPSFCVDCHRGGR